MSTSWKRLSVFGLGLVILGVGVLVGWDSPGTGGKLFPTPTPTPVNPLKGCPTPKEASKAFPLPTSSNSAASRATDDFHIHWFLASDDPDDSLTCNVKFNFYQFDPNADDLQPCDGLFSATDRLNDSAPPSIGLTNLHHAVKVWIIPKQPPVEGRIYVMRGKHLGNGSPDCKGVGFFIFEFTKKSQ